MHNSPKALTEPIDAIVFDCDGTLSDLEGINVLAEQNGVGKAVSELTEQAMSTTGIQTSLYSDRLALTQPTHAQLMALADSYYQHRTPDIDHVLSVFRTLGKAVYVLSAGMNPAVTEFAKKLEIPESHVIAVNLVFDAHGHYQDYQRDDLPCQPNGKRKAITSLLQKHPRIIHVGDGMNDYEAHDIVTRFVGYGGAYYRESIRERTDYYITDHSMLPLLDWTLTQKEFQND